MQSLHRCFVAVFVSDPVREAVGALVSRLRSAGADIGWTRPEAMHLTLKFLGEIHEKQVESVKDALNRVAARHTVFGFSIRGLGGFPGLARPRVLWAGVHEASGLLALQKDVESELARLGFRGEGRPFSPHLTLGRVRSERNLGTLLGRLKEHADQDFGHVVADAVHLMESELLPSGARYMELLRAGFAG